MKTRERFEVDVAASPEGILRACRRRGLEVREMRFGSQTSHPGSRHWHIRRPEGSGTLELTSADGRVWLTVKPLWDGGWATKLAQKLAAGGS